MSKYFEINLHHVNIQKNETYQTASFMLQSDLKRLAILKIHRANVLKSMLMKSLMSDWLWEFDGSPVRAWDIKWNLLYSKNCFSYENNCVQLKLSLAI